MLVLFPAYVNVFFFFLLEIVASCFVPSTEHIALNDLFLAEFEYPPLAYPPEIQLIIPRGFSYWLDDAFSLPRCCSERSFVVELGQHFWM